MLPTVTPLYRIHCCFHCYPHMPIGKVWIYRLLSVCLCFVQLRITPPIIKLAASNFVPRFICVQGWETPIFVNFAPPEAQNRTNRPARGPRTPLQYIARNKIGMSGYRLVPTDVLVKMYFKIHQETRKSKYVARFFWLTLYT